MTTMGSRILPLAYRVSHGHSPTSVSTPQYTRRLCQRQASTESSQEKYVREVRQAQEQRDKIDRQSNEYSKTGSDDAVAQHDVSFDSSLSTDPQRAKEAVDGKHPTHQPLDVSPANPEVSAPSEGEHQPGVKDNASQEKTFPGDPSTKSKTSSKQKNVFAGSSSRHPQNREMPHSANIPTPGSR